MRTYKIKKFNTFRSSVLFLITLDNIVIYNRKYTLEEHTFLELLHYLRV